MRSWRLPVRRPRHRLPHVELRVQLVHEVSVVPTSNDTEVTITPSVPMPDHNADEPYTVARHRRGAVLPQAHGDGTGTRIQSDQPVAVFSGMNCTNVPADYAVLRPPRRAAHADLDVGPTVHHHAARLTPERRHVPHRRPHGRHRGAHRRRGGRHARRRAGPRADPHRVVGHRGERTGAGRPVRQRFHVQRQPG